jgi:hypothetical protein
MELNSGGIGGTENSLFSKKDNERRALLASPYLPKGDQHLSKELAAKIAKKLEDLKIPIATDADIVEIDFDLENKEINPNTDSQI